MARYERLDKDPAITVGTRYDTCWFCCHEKLKENRQDPKNLRNTFALVSKDLEGTFEGQCMLRINVPGGPYLICENHLKHYLKEFGKIKSGETS